MLRALALQAALNELRHCLARVHVARIVNSGTYLAERHEAAVIDPVSKFTAEGGEGQGARHQKAAFLAARKAGSKSRLFTGGATALMKAASSLARSILGSVKVT